MLKRRRKKVPRFVALSRSLLDSFEWKSLTNSEKLVYIYIKKNFNGINNGEIGCTYIELRSLFCDKVTSKAISGLIKKEWISKKHHGGLFRYQSFYELTGKHDKLFI